MPPLSRHAVPAALLAVAALAAAPHARADEPAFGPNDVPTLFFIAKNLDKNRVDYGIRLDASCAPQSDDAIVPYWRLFEGAPPGRTKPLSLIDHVPYGIAEQKLLSKSASGAEYRVRLKQLARPITIVTKKESDGKCSATARARIGDGTAQLVSVFAQMKSIITADYIDVFGKKLDDGSAVTERIKK
jgi:hypothetical protein